ncbi:competence protein CoiA [Larkinella arboricola]
MKYALFEGGRIKAVKGIKAMCPCCNTEVIAKTGKYKASHWAHKSLSHCDVWWENETEWHRNWKNKFDEKYQEIIMYDTLTGEKHIADIFSPAGTVIEFQHSYISQEEVNSREAFYLKTAKKMIWIIDCTSRINRVNFQLSFPNISTLHIYKDIKITWFSQSSILKRWSLSNAYVLFDLGDGFLWYLKKYDQKSKEAILNLRISEDFVRKNNNTF